MREIRAGLCGVALFALVYFSATLVAADANSAGGKLLSGKAAMGDWTSDAPGVRRKITVDDLPAPSSNVLAINPPRVIPRPAGAELHVPFGFKTDMYASGFRDPRFLLTAPNGDIFVSESRANQIKVIRGANAESVQLFADKDLNEPFGIAFYPPGPDPKFLYVANTDGVIRFPYQNGDLKARGPAAKLSAQLSGGGLLRGGGHWTRDIVFSQDGKKMYVSIGSRSNNSDSAAEADRARIFEFNPDGSGQKVYAWGIRNAVGIAFRPGSDELWMSTNERDELGDDLVPDYISSVRSGGFYGWPWFYIGNHVDPAHKGKTCRSCRQGHHSGCACAIAFRHAQSLFLHRRSISGGIQRGHLRRLSRLVEPNETHRLQNCEVAFRSRDRKNAWRIRRLCHQVRDKGWQLLGAPCRHHHGQGRKSFV